MQLSLLSAFASADDQLVLSGSGDSQTCLDGDLSCAALYQNEQTQGSGYEEIYNLTANFSSQYSYYTTNEFVQLSGVGQKGLLNNDGAGQIVGKLLIVSEFDSGSGYAPIAVAFNDTSLNRTIVSGGSLDVAMVYNAAPWNTTLAGPGNYRLSIYFYNDEGIAYTAYTPFIVTDDMVSVQIFTQSGHTYSNNVINLSFNATAHRPIDECEAFVDGSLAAVIAANNGAYSSILLQNLSSKTMNITVRCNDTLGVHADDSITARVVKASQFGGSTTDLSAVNISSIPNLVLEKPSAGKISFVQNVDLSQGADIDSHVVIAPKTITVNSAALSALNKSAVLTFYGVDDIEHPAIYRDGEFCAECSIDSFSGGNLVATVQHFSSYTIGPNSRLEASDTTDLVAKQIGDQVQIIGNYTNVTSGVAITSALCNVTFDDTGTQSLTYDSGLQSYTLNRTFSTTGVFFYTVRCSANGFEALNTTDYVSIGVLNGPVAPVNLSVGESTRGQVNTDPIYAEAQGGNATEMNIDSIAITNTWQGVYGNLSGEVVLSTDNNEVFYNWSLDNVTGEIYASRSSAVNFATIGCGADDTFVQEDTFLGSAGSVDAVNNTFSQKSHPSFATGSVGITQNSCPSTNLHTSTGIDNSKYYQLLLVDGANNTIYTSLLQPNSVGFNGRLNDFQIMVPTRSNTIEQYFYWAEIN